MNPPFAVWVTHTEPAPKLAVAPLGAEPQGAAVSPLVPLAFAEAAAAWGHEWSRRALSEPPQSRRLRLWRRSRDSRALLVHRLRRHIRRFLSGRFPQLGPPVRWRWPGAEDATSEWGPRQGLLPTLSRLRPTSPELREAVCSVLEGRTYTADDVATALGQEGIVVDTAIDVALANLVRDGDLQRRAAVEWTPHALESWHCVRCGSTRIGSYACYRCGLDACPQCDTCHSLGRMTGCASLYRRPQPVDSESGKGRSIALNVAFPLTPQQSTISQALLEAEGDALVWAACGAGKTEVTYECIRRIVEKGGRALFAVPRRDVVEQLGRRLSEVFDGVDVAALFGGTAERYTRAPIVVATVHQTLRFFQAFDVAIIDEVDAYPLNREPWLLDAVETALQPHGRTIAMSATPSPAILQQSQREGWALHMLPARPHGHPLPIPEVVRVRGAVPIGRSASSTPDLAPLLDVIDESVRKGRRVLVFVPSVSLCTQVADGIQAAAERLTVTSVHAGDAERSEKLRRIEEGHIDVLVSTTVLERGITLPHLDAVVFAADFERVWDAASLIQMAGRVGRSPLDPAGRVVFLASRVTPAMKEATATIYELNGTARKLGLLRDKAPLET